jgi:N-acetylneuraminic acid mutarotase
LLSNGPGLGNFIVAGINAGAEGRMIMLNNKSGFSFEIYNEDINAPAVNRIKTGTGNTLAIYPDGNVVLQYATAEQRWLVKSAHNSSLDDFGNATLPSTAIVLSETEQNNSLQSAGFTLAGALQASQSLAKQGAYTWFYPPTANNAPILRGEHTAVWTNEKMLIWGGYDPAAAVYLKDGKIYDVLSDSWTTMPVSPLLERSLHTAQWTGTDMLIWGGINENFTFGNGAKFNLQTNAWLPMSAVNAPASRFNFTSVWTGTEMIIFGGRLAGVIYRTDNKKYNPLTDSWTNISNVNAPAPRINHTAIWTGDKMIIFGGKLMDGTITNTGAIYDPVADSWTTITTTNAPPDGMSEHSAVWTGSKMIVCNGRKNPTGVENNIYLYDPSANTWQQGSNVNKPLSTIKHTVVWAGDRMIVFGGTGNFDGGVYDPVANTWAPDNIVNQYNFVSHTAIWTGTAMIVTGNEPAQILKKDFAAPQQKIYYLYIKQ